MSEMLRWILVCLAVVLLLGIYLWGRRGSSQGSHEERARTRAEPTAFDDFEATPVPEELDVLSPEHGPAEPCDPAVSASGRDPRRGRVEPTFGEDASAAADSSATAELPAQAPTLSLSDSPAPRRIERRKIVALRLAAGPQRFGGEALRAAFAAQSLEHGKYQVFHRLHQGNSLFCAASMVEPGTFELETMAQASYPGVTLFAQLPGPVDGSETVDALVKCAQALQQTLGGSLQDERGIPLTAHRIERLREEVADFERTLSRSRSSAAIPH